MGNDLTTLKSEVVQQFAVVDSTLKAATSSVSSVQARLEKMELDVSNLKSASAATSSSLSHFPSLHANAEPRRSSKTLAPKRSDPPDPKRPLKVASFGTSILSSSPSAPALSTAASSSATRLPHSASHGTLPDPASPDLVVIDEPVKDLRPKDIRVSGWRRVLSKVREADLRILLAQLGVRHPQEDCKVSYGREPLETFVTLKFSTPELAQQFLRSHRFADKDVGYDSGDNPKLMVNGTKLYISYQRYGRERLTEIFAKKARQVVLAHRAVLGLPDLSDKDVVKSDVTGGLFVAGSLIGHCQVDKVRDEQGHHPITFKLSPIFERKDLVDKFDFAKFLTLFDEKTRA